MTGGRVWLAFEVRPGVTRPSQRDDRQLWRSLAESCRGPDGKLNRDEYLRWMELLVEHGYLPWGEA